VIRQIVLDTETTGLHFKSGDRVIEIGCVEIINRRFTGSEYQTYLNPDQEIDKKAIEIHGLTFEFLQDKPRFKDVVKEFLEFIHGSELLIHNAEFDIGFLNNELNLLPGNKSLIHNVANKITDTYHLAREKHPGQRNSLDALIQRYQIKGYDREYHGALLDSKILGSVYLAMTGGQSDILFETNPINEGLNKIKEIQKKSPSKRILKSKVAQLSQEEEKEHLEYLRRMKEDTGVEPLWLKECLTKE